MMLLRNQFCYPLYVYLYLSLNSRSLKNTVNKRTLSTHGIRTVGQYNKVRLKFKVFKFKKSLIFIIIFYFSLQKTLFTFMLTTYKRQVNSNKKCLKHNFLKKLCILIKTYF